MAAAAWRVAGLDGRQHVGMATSSWSCGGRRTAPTAAAFPALHPRRPAGEVTFTGTDTLRIAGGKLAGYRANADSVLFIQQLGVRHVPAG